MAEDKVEVTDEDGKVAPNPAENPRNRIFNEIAETEADAKPDLVDVTGDEQPVDVVDEPEEAPAAKAEAASPPKFKIKANGVEEELTQEELVKRAEKATGADQVFQEAARLRREAEEIRTRAEVKPAATEEEDPRALARAIQMGNEDEAAAVIERLLKRPSQGADMSIVDQRIEFRESAKWFEQNYGDIVQDPHLRKLALDTDEEMVKKGDRRNYRDRYKDIGDQLRTWRDGLAKSTPVNAEKQERKATLHVVKAASVRAAAPAGDDDGPSDREFIAAEARRRGQGYPK